MNIFIIVWGIWILSEVYFLGQRRSKSKGTSELDKNSLKIIWITIIISIFMGVLLKNITLLPISGYQYISYIGILLIVCGIFIRVIAIRTLGRYFTVDLSIQNDQKIVKKGLYKYIRHPSYTGSLFSFIGLGVSFNNWLSLIVIVIPIFISFLYRINIEEKVLLKQFGSEYIEYQQSTKRLIPLIY